MECKKRAALFAPFRKLLDFPSRMVKTQLLFGKLPFVKSEKMK
jgi:hypothetical protein